MDIEETNRLRLSLGMKLLPVPGAGPVFKEASVPSAPGEEVASTLETRTAESYDNYRKAQEAEQAKKKRDAKAEAIKKARDAAKRFSKLEGKGLGDEDGDVDMDAKAWLMKQKKRQKEIDKARKREQEAAEAEAAAAAEYTAKDLAGVKVGHELDTFEEGEEQVLTLKDTTIDQNEEEGDELENLDLRERERLNEKLELKKKKPVYNPNDDDESGEKSILAHYDEEIVGKKGHKFTLDGKGSTAEAAAENGTVLRSKPKAINLDILKDELKSDYFDLSEIKTKKPKKKKEKKTKSTRQKAVDEDDVMPAADAPPSLAEDDTKMDLDTVVAPSKKRSFEESFVDDDELAASLAKQRRNALKNRKTLRPDDLALKIREEAATTPTPDNDADAGVGMVIDETSEFVANLQKPTAPEKKAKSKLGQPDVVTSMNADSDEEGDVNMDRSYAEVEEEQDRAARLREKSASIELDNGLEKEATLENGIGSTLKLLRERNLLKDVNSGDLNEQFRRQQNFIAEKQRLETAAEQKAREQRERDRASGRLDRMTAREREDYARSQNNMRDVQESRQLASLFEKTYKPTVDLKYIDDDGRSMDTKEAFKHLSHKFHGKGSGKQKTEKHLKKIADEQRREAKSSLDGSQMSGMSGATNAQIKKKGQAGVRLA